MYQKRSFAAIPHIYRQHFNETVVKHTMLQLPRDRLRPLPYLTHHPRFSNKPPSASHLAGTTAIGVSRDQETKATKRAESFKTIESLILIIR